METETEPKRGPGRPPLNRTPPRDMDSRTRAAERARAIRANAPDEAESTDRFYIDPSLIPDGWSYQWKRHLLVNKEDPAYAVSLARAGWEPVPADRHPEMMPRGWKGLIERDGMMLMERPLELTIEAEHRATRTARDAVRVKEQQLGITPSGTLARDADPRVAPRITKSYSPVEIPE